MDIAIIIIVSLLILVGFIGIIVPVLPGAGLMYLGILLYAGYFGWDTVGFPVLIILAVLALLTIAMDYITAASGAKKYGGSKYAAWGSALGGFLGFFVLNLPGLLIGLFAGAVVGEMLYAKKDWETSLEAGKGAVIGFLVGTLAKILVGVSMIGLFLWKVLS